MSDGSFLQWPFFNDEHQALAARLDEWASRHLPTLTADEHHDLDGTCKAIVKALGEAGFAAYAVPRVRAVIMKSLMSGASASSGRR